MFSVLKLIVFVISTFSDLSSCKIYVIKGTSRYECSTEGTTFSFVLPRPQPDLRMWSNWFFSSSNAPRYTQSPATRVLGGIWLQHQVKAEFFHCTTMGKSDHHLSNPSLLINPLLTTPTTHFMLDFPPPPPNRPCQAS